MAARGAGEEPGDERGREHGTVHLAGLRGAASGLLGVLGGPWGAAFTGATALVGLWLQKQADARRRVEELTSAIEADSGALGENTRQKLVNQLETDGVLQAARTPVSYTHLTLPTSDLV